MDVKVEVQNIGSDEQEDVYVVLENNELEIYEKSYEFDIEEFDEDDIEKISFSVRIPEDVDEKDYELKATVYFDDGDMENSRSETFTVLNDVITLYNAENLLSSVINPVIYLSPLKNSIEDLIVLKSDDVDKEGVQVLEKNSIVLSAVDDNAQRGINLPSLASIEEMILISLIVGIVVVLIIIFVVWIVRRR